jgi:hypothetical protein
MERAVNVPGGCDEALRTHPHQPERISNPWTFGLVVIPATLALFAFNAAIASAQTQAPPSSDRGSAGAASPGQSKPVAAPAALKRPTVEHERQSARPRSPVIVANPEPNLAPRFKIRDKFNQCVVARLYGQSGDRTQLILPDGQLGTPSLLVPTDEPFQPFTSDQLLSLLQENNGDFGGYPVLKTDHYLIFYKSTRAFAEDSGSLLEDLYRGLIDTFGRNNVPVHESEFPLVAVIFATEADFQAHKQVDPQVRAYYEYYTNRIFFFQKSDRDALEPKVAALLKPQTVAHEGAHQILSNIGVQPRLNAWPPWLVEGLAEYCATTVIKKRGIIWDGLAAINSLHMATMRELEDPLSNGKKVARKESASPSEALLLKTALSPTDYALAWALTHYLAQTRGNQFVKYLNAMRELPPLERRTPAENLAEFRKFFNDAPPRLDKKLAEYVYKLSQKKSYDTLYYYAVVFVQPLGNGTIRRAATFSQSPQIIQEWVQQMTSATGDYPSCQVSVWPTRAAAEKAVQDWMREN